MNTTQPIVVPGPLAWEPLPPPPQRRLLRALLAAIVLLSVLFAAVEVSLPYYAIAPGSARQVNDLIRVPRDRAFPPDGEVYLATVSLGQVNVIEAVRGWIDPATDVVPQERVLGSTPRGQFRRQNLQLMDDSKEAAVVAALRRLGFAVTEHGSGSLVVRVEEGSPADGRLSEGDVITAVDGRPTPLSHQAVEGIRAHKPGDRVRLDVRGVDGESRVEEVVLASRPKSDSGFLGVFLRTKEQKFEHPFDVTIDSGDIGGPSAGLAFTLGVIDVLTAGELTGGRKVAATGTMELDGRVGDVGGVAQKTAAVRRAGADYFLVPADEYDEAVAHAGTRLKVMKVATLDDAIAALGRVGGDVSALGPPPDGTPG